MLEQDEIERYWEEVWESVPVRDVEVYRPSIPCSSMEDIGGIRDWPVPSVVSVQFIGPRPQLARTMFGDPEQEDERVRLKPENHGAVQAGDVLRDPLGRVWWVPKPEYQDFGLPFVEIGVQLVPPRAVPKALRVPGGGVPAAPVQGATMKRISATLVDGTTESYATATLNAAVPAGVDPIGMSNRMTISGTDIQISSDRTQLRVTLPSEYGPWVDGDFVEFYVEGI